MRSDELVSLMLGVARKDAHRVHDMLSRGSFVSGASRFRWEPLAVSREVVEQALSRHPDDEPSRPFSWTGFRAVRFRLLIVERETAARKRWFQRRSFLDALLLLAPGSFQYVEYSYKEAADVYRRRFDSAEQLRLREATSLLAYRSLARQIFETDLAQGDFLISR